VTEPTGPPAEHKDRSTLLFAFGIAEIVMGLFTLLMAAVTVVAMLAGTGGLPGAPGVQPPNPRMVAPGLFFYLLLAAYFITTGIGSMRIRRWARPIVLIVSWLWLVSGVVSLFMTSIILPRFMEQARPPGIDAEMMSFAQGCAFALLAVFQVILPGIFITVYGSAGVRATFETRDRLPRWTDRCPTPVLGICLALVYAAVTLPLSAVSGLPLFGLGLSRPASVAVCLALAVFLPFLALVTYQLRPWAWWVLLGFSFLGDLSSISFLSRSPDWKQMFQQMGLQAADVAMMEKTGLTKFFKGPEMIAVVAVCALGSLAYLLWVKKHFRRGDSAGQPRQA
jgi:hypothetical protein